MSVFSLVRGARIHEREPGEGGTPWRVVHPSNDAILFGCSTKTEAECVVAWLDTIPKAFEPVPESPRSPNNETKIGGFVDVKSIRDLINAAVEAHRCFGSGENGQGRRVLGEVLKRIGVLS